MGLVEDLREDLARGEVLVVAGTGVSIQATGGAKCATWDGLILDGIEYAVGTTLLTRSEARTLRGRLKKKSVEERLAVAQRVSEVLGGPELRRWLAGSVGRLELKDRSIVDAIHALGAPIATTNYDDLLTRDRAIAHVPWTDVAAAQEVLRGRRKAVLHLHGCFDHPESVILGSQSYQTLLGTDDAQGIQRAIAATRTFLFVGCGDGLSDPNLAPLLAAFSQGIFRHYCLCLKQERKALQRRRPKGERLFYVEYGDDYGDLGPFLRSLAPYKPAIALPNPGYCFGREREVEEVVTALLAAQPIPILGGPGMGKTTLTLEALHDPRVAERFHERRWFVRCDGVKSRAELAAAIALAVRLPVTPNVETAVLAELAKAPAALALDNMETPLDADGKPVEELLSILANIPTLALAVTIRGHRRPGGIPWTFDTKPERLTDQAAAEVFVAVSGKRKFADDPDLPRLLVALDGVPLAITLMARYAELFDSLAPVRSKWKAKRTAMLKEGEEQDRLKNIAVSYELSIGVLREPARRLLSVLAMLPDGVAYRDLEEVFPDPDDAADELRHRALVFDEEQRLRMRAPLREYVAAAHPPDAEDEQRVIDYYLAFAAEEGSKIGRTGGADAVAHLTPDVANVEAILGRSVPGRDGKVENVIYGWAKLMRFTGLGSIATMERIAAIALGAGLTKVAAQCFEGLGHIALARSHYDSARAYFEKALPLYQSIGNVVGEANCVHCLGDIALTRSENETARAYFEEALLLYQKASVPQGEANCVWSLGGIALKLSDYHTASARCAEALPLYRKVGDVLGEAICLGRLGDIALSLSDYRTARLRYQEALPLCRKVGSLRGEANCIAGFGQIASADGAYDEAESSLHQALALYERIGDPHAIGLTRLRLARIAQYETSRAAHVEAARDAWRSIGRDDLIANLDEEFG